MKKKLQETHSQCAHFLNSTMPLRRSGFALIATISIMILLVLLAMAMLSLSNVEQRSSQSSRAMAEAQANARLALMFAIGELQAQMGPDQRITANAARFDSTPDTVTIDGVNNPHWLGAWDSWIAGSPDPETVNPNYPSPASHHQTIGAGTVADDSMATQMHPDYAQKNLHFRKWLVSLPTEDQEAILSYNSTFTDASINPIASSDAVRIVGEGSLGSSAAATDFVNAPLVDVVSETGQLTGRYGWWVGDQGQKASILADPYNNGVSLTNADRVFRSQAPGAMNTKEISGFTNVVDEQELDKLASLKTLELVELNPAPAPGDTTLSQLNFHNAATQNLSVMADVREGGLKRDLSTILEQPISLANNSNDYMLYRFGNTLEDCVPIQDLTAYYQLYNNSPTWEGVGTLGGVRHNVTPAVPARVMQVDVPDYGADADRTKFLRQYTTLYRNPVPIKVQFVVGIGATPITAAERTAIDARRATAGLPPLRATDNSKMLLGVKPVVTLWNPSNLPLVMNTNASQIMRVSFPPFALRWRKYRAAGAPAQYDSDYVNLNYSISNESTGDGRARSLGPYIMQLQFARTTPIVFQPGEVKMFSIPIAATNFLETGGNSSFANTPLYQAQAFLPDGFYVTAKSVVQSNGLDAVQFPNSAGTFVSYAGFYMTFGDGDKIDMEVVTEAQTPRSRAISNANEIVGSAFHFFMTDASYTANLSSHFRNYQFVSRFGGSDTPSTNPNWTFNRNLMLSGFPNGAEIPYEGQTNAMPGSEILAATANGEAKALLNFFMMAGCEVNESNAGGAGAGRRISARPFLHGSTLSAPQISGNGKNNLYDYSWEWQVNKINNLDEAFHDDGSSRGFYGGGYTVENGAPHIVQQYLPALPPISIACLSSAHLGGFSLANNPVLSTGAANMAVGGPGSVGTIRDAPGAGAFRQVTATGQGGLAPHSLQSIGNSYAHPNIPANQAFTRYTQLLNMDIDTLTPTLRAYADHSYLANKALWDDYFFSSITPQPNNIPLYGGAASKTALAVANSFLYGNVPLPNRSLIPYTSNLSTTDYSQLVSEYATYNNGFADKIASHIVATGSFNINSTSVEAWKVLLTSLKGKELIYLNNQAASIGTTTTADTPLTPGMLANGEAVTSSELSADANAPADQWTSSRSITEAEIDALAVAMVKQVKLRGPFLSMSEFVNRRLDASNITYSTKGALQAAIDDPSVTINAAFRTTARMLDGEAASFTATAAFPEALSGPIAYGSTPYVDQADILRHIGSSLTPRSDTFIVRAYGDSLDVNGDVQARVWCEAVVQRTPEYLDPSTASGDRAHIKHADLVSDANKVFGRKLEMVSFRWLSADEI